VWANSFYDIDEYGNGLDRDHDIGNGGLCGFVSHTDLFDYFSLIVAFLC
jgi:hypothetical protein